MAAPTEPPCAYTLGGGDACPRCARADALLNAYAETVALTELERDEARADAAVYREMTQELLRAIHEVLQERDRLRRERRQQTPAGRWAA